MNVEVGKWLFSVISLMFVFLFIYVEGKLRKGNEASDMSPTKEDQNSTRFVGVAFGISMIAITASIILNVFDILYYNSPWIAIVGIAGIIGGILIRISAARTLGRFYTRILKITDKHELVQDGWYKYIRHPGYMSSIILFVSAGIACENFLSLGVILITILPAYIYRISVEEKMLVGQFGDVYISYQKRSARLVPGIY